MIDNIETNISIQISFAIASRFASPSTHIKRWSNTRIRIMRMDFLTHAEYRELVISEAA